MSRCGQPTEVYSRITGYYRPVQNWNAGKTQEYKDRVEYNIGNSTLTHTGPLADGEASKRLEEKAAQVSAAEAPATAEKASEPACAEGKAILFATATCPNCRIACTYLDKAGYAYEKLLANENADLAVSYGVKQAPTLIVPKADGTYEKYAGAGAIKGYLEEII